MYEELKQRFLAAFHREAAYVFSAPGRTELSGNHTDHQLGKVLAGAVDLDTVAAVALNGESIIRVLSEGYPLCEVSLVDLSVHPGELGTTAALIRGTAAGIAERGYLIPGFDACVTSRVLAGSGLSSSAAFEVLIGTVINHLTAAGLTPLEIAQLGQYAENVYFGKPCGLMDQAASSLGGIITIDFANERAPQVERLDIDLAGFGYALCVVDSGADHADLTDEYAAIPGELHSICAHFGKAHLREVPEEAGLVPGDALAAKADTPERDVVLYRLAECERQAGNPDAAEKACAETELSGMMEGLYIKIEEDGRVVDRMKFVRSAFLQCVDFSEQHWIDKPIIPNQLAVPVESLF